ncbi:MAG: hypothetical protein QM730_05215 [Anaerolineales bacterium]
MHTNLPSNICKYLTSLLLILTSTACQPTKNSATASITNTPVIAQKIAFVSARDGNAEVYVMNSDGSEQTNLTNNSAEDWFPTWSPDGEQLAFSSDRDGNPAIYIMNIDGSNLIRLTETSNSFPAWSPDGTRIAFACYFNSYIQIA